MKIALPALAVLFVASAALPVPAGAATYFDDPFDTRPLGALPSGGSAPEWIHSSGSAGETFTVVTDPSPASASDRALLVVRPGTSAYLYTKSSPSISLDHQSVIHISFDLNQPAQYNDEDNTGVFVSVDGGSTASRAAAISVTGGGSLSYNTYDAQGGSTSHALAPLTQGAWTHFDFAFKYDASQSGYVYSLSVGDTPVATGQLAPPLSDGTDPRLVISPQSSNSATYFDTVLITSSPVPEPAAGALTLVGLCGLAVRRRRTDAVERSQ